MQKYLILFFLAVFVNANLFAGDVKKYGEEITSTEKVKISALLENPKEYEGKKVLVEGTVLNVCAKRGCWMNIASDTPFNKFQVKVTDGVIIFPMEARGRTAYVEGRVERLQLSREDAIAYYRHRAEEQGKPFDPTSISGPEKIYRLRALGAVIAR